MLHIILFGKGCLVKKFPDMQPGSQASPSLLQKGREGVKERKKDRETEINAMVDDGVYSAWTITFH